MNAKPAILLMPRVGDIKLNQDRKHRVRGNRLTPASDLINHFCSVMYPVLLLMHQCPKSEGSQDVSEKFICMT